MLISIEKLNKSFGDDVILKNINLTIEEKCRYGLIGVNGAGKSTLLSIIVGALSEDSGNIYKNPAMSIGYLKQNNGLERTSTIYKEMRSVFSDVLSAEKKMRELEVKMAELTDHNSDEYKRISAEYSKNQIFFESCDGYNIDVKIKMILNGMGFRDKDNDTVISTLSGGEKTRLAIARLLLEEPNLLILDEPTNHLDFKTLNWLEDYLISYSGAVLIVSHDRYFLDKTVDNIFEIERGRLTSYKGNYSKYLVLKEQQRERLEKEYEMQQIQIAQMQDYIDRNMARASTSASAKSRVKALEAMDIIEKPDGELSKMRLKFEIKKQPYKDVLTVRNLDVCVGDEKKVLCRNLSLDVKRGERIAIIGDNGIGKSSFLKMIQNLIPMLNGEIEWGKNCTISYYEQENLNLDYNKIALDELWDRFPDISESEIRRVLGNVLLTKDDVYKPVSVISGGERAKLAFCIIMLEKSNVIILDEPTNHLDLPSKEVLEKALLDYEGTLIFVSHDRYLLNKVPQKIIEIKRDGIDIYQGNYDYYKERLALKTAENEQKIQAEKALKNENSAEENKSGNSFYRSKEQRKLDTKHKLRLKEIETLISEREAEIEALETEMTDEKIYSDYVLMNEKCQRLEACKAEIDELYEEWALLDEELNK